MPDNVDLYQKALKLNPDLWCATQLVARIQGKDVFPIRSVEGLISVFRDKPGANACELDGVTLTPEHAKKFFPAKFFPINNESQLLAKLYAAFCAGRSFHLLEAQVEHYRKSISEGRSQNA